VSPGSRAARAVARNDWLCWLPTVTRAWSLSLALLLFTDEVEHLFQPLTVLYKFVTNSVERATRGLRNIEINRDERYSEALSKPVSLNYSAKVERCGAEQVRDHPLKGMMGRKP
jgi:hypothetical protein